MAVAGVKLCWYEARILWVDCLGALAVGTGGLVLREWLAGLYGMTVDGVTAMAVMNLLYGCYSLQLAVRRAPPLGMLRALVVANLSWTVVCVGIAVWAWGALTWLGVGQVLAEGAYVGWLGWTEWRVAIQKNFLFVSQINNLK